MKSVCCAVILWCLPLHIYAVGGNLQLAPYYDSNVFELPSNKQSSYGLKFTGRLHQTYQSNSLKLFGELAAQGYLDGQYSDESKVIVSPELSGRYRLGPRTNVNGRISHFQKSFEHTGFTYVRSNYHLGIEQNLRHRFKFFVTGDMEVYRIQRTDFFHFQEATFSVGSGYHWKNGSSVGISGRGFRLTSKDYPAFAKVNDTTVVPLDETQIDRGYEVVVRGQYAGKIIPGVAIAFKKSRSNSLVGDYSQIYADGYLSGRITQFAFYHIAFRIVEKTYAHQGIAGKTGYRDPEQPSQNRLYCRIEQQINPTVSTFVQVSYLKNETLINRVYFSKTLFEAGVKFSL